MSPSKIKTAQIIIIAAILIQFSFDAAAVGIGVSPGSIEFRNVLRSGYSEKELVLSTSSDVPVKCEISAEGPFANWTSYAPGKTFILPPRYQTKVKVMVEPPADVPNGVYEGYVAISVLPTEAVSGGTGSSISAGVSVRASVEINDIETRHFRMYEASVRDTEEGKPIEFSVVLENDGNIRLKPRIHIDILNSDRTSVLNTLDYSDKLLLPTRKEEVIISVSNNLPVGKYAGRVTAYLDDQKINEITLDFEVLERGSLRIQGRLISVELNKIWVYTGELVEVRATFKNDGIMATPASFSGKASIGDMVVDLINSDEVEVPAGQEGQLVAYFTPKKPGRYVISGRVRFFNKVTAEKSSILNVKPAEKTQTTTPQSSGSQPGDYGNTTDSLLIVAIGAAAVILIISLIFRGRGAKANEDHEDHPQEKARKSKRKRSPTEDEGAVND